MSIIYPKYLGNSLFEVEESIEYLVGFIFLFIVDVFEEVALYRLKLFQGLAFEVGSCEQHLGFFLLEVLVIDIEVGTELGKEALQILLAYSVEPS